MSTTTGITNTVSLSNNGRFDQSGQTTINGLTTNNGVGPASTDIGNDTNLAGPTTIRSGSSSLVVSQGGTAITTTGSNTVTGATNSISATGSNTVTGATNTISATGSNTVTGASNAIEALAPNGSNTIRALGPNASNVIVGTTNVNVSENFASNINTGESQGNVTVGNASNVTQLNSAINYIGVAERYATTNMIGTGPGAFTSINEIGNRNLASKVTALAGNSTLSLMNNNASLTVPNRTSNANGLDVNQGSSVMTGGSSDPARLALTDNIATFSRAATGAPITVTGVADGRNDFDAVNVRQFASAIAATAAMGNVPQLAAGMDRSIGLGFGNYMGKTGLAFGMNLRSSNVAYRLSVSSGLNDGAKAVVAGGASWSW